MVEDGAGKIFLRDTIKKQHGFLGGRQRHLSYTDAVIPEVFGRLRTLVAEGRVERFRVVFGSDIVELHFSGNPLLPATFRTDRFLATNFEALQAPAFDPGRTIPLQRIPDILARMKELRHMERKFLEAFRINVCGDDIWAYFSSARSLFGNYQEFLAYTELRDEQEKINAEMSKLLAFPGDEFESLSDWVVRDEETQADQRCDDINTKTIDLFQQQRIVEFQLYCGSGLVRVISGDDLHTPQHYTIDQYLREQDLAHARKVDLEHGMPPETGPRKHRLSTETLAEMLDLATRLRVADQELYLRVLYIDAVSDTVVTSFSCGGTYCQTAEEFITPDFARSFA